MEQQGFYDAWSSSVPNCLFKVLTSIGSQVALPLRKYLWYFSGKYLVNM